MKQRMYFDRKLVERPGLWKFFSPSINYEYLIISITGEGNLGFSVLITNHIPDYSFVKVGNGGCQCFPLYWYEENKHQQQNLFDEAFNNKYIRRDAISDFILNRAKQQYGKSVTKEDIFYYVYGFLHSPQYRETFASDLKKMLPRLPLVEDVRHFWAFSKAGRSLADLHLNYESIPKCPGVLEVHTPLSITDSLKQANDDELKYIDYRVKKMRFPSKTDKSKIIYNSLITIENIPPEAYDYIVNGKSAIEWIMERYQVTTHRESGITNDPNDWSRESNNPRYILDLLHSIINLSIQSVEIISKLPDISGMLKIQ
jgi:predicted helicase